MIFETHAHYDDEQFEEDRDVLLKEMKSKGIGTIVNICATYESLQIVMAMVEKYPFMYAAVGIHPDDVGSLNDHSFEEMKQLYRNEKVVAVGEIGLDYYWEEETREVQKAWFIKQLLLAKERSLPLVIHSRDAAADTLQIMKEYGQGLEGVIHCFSYSREMALEYVDMGYYIGVGGVITFKNGKKLKEVVEAIPLTSILLETDCPYLAPVPNRGKRNTSLNLTYVAEEIARIKAVSYEEVVSVTEKNAKKLYRL